MHLETKENILNLIGNKMKTTVYQNDFDNAFIGSQYENNFTPLARSYLYEHLENEELMEGVDYDFEAWAVCEDYTEFKNWEDYFSQFGEWKPYKTLKQLSQDYEVILINHFERPCGFIVKHLNN